MRTIAEKSATYNDGEESFLGVSPQNLLEGVDKTLEKEHKT
jgi:hypothetical protein